MSLANYQRQVLEWEKIYGKPRFGLCRFDPTELRVACAKCDEIRPKMSRHHKGSEFFFALILPELYAARYISFHKEDVARLCDKCHKNVEKYYEPLKLRMHIEYYDWLNKQRKVPTKAWCDAWITEFKTAFEVWLGKPVRKRKKKRSVIWTKKKRKRS